ncbi:CBS domain-containing protein [Streptomyces sp. NPDC058434]|uniref:CBS domain-containing protein n=1 Tax=Streptomyces sp. NPDC058434 TaxID=3346498 RepID=UPI00365961C9
MRHSKIGSLMVRNVVAVAPESSFKQIAGLLDEHRISGVPVVDSERRVIGVVSETDLVLRRPGLAPEWEAAPGAQTELVAGSPDSDGPAPNAADLMSAPAVTVDVEETVAGAARTMAAHRVERLPVVDRERRLMGMVTRRDLLQVFLRPDAEIREEIVEELFERTLWLPPGKLTVRVVEGVVTLDGELERLSDVLVAVRLVRQTDGVVTVIDRLRYDVDDTPVGRATGPAGEARRRKAAGERSP